MKRILTSLAAVVALGAAATPVWAHHSGNAEFDTTKTAVISGTFTGLDEINPHSRWQMVAKGPDGQPQNWVFQGTSPNRIRAVGIKVKDDLKPGTVYTFYYCPSWNGTNIGLLLAMDINGRKVTFLAI